MIVGFANKEAIGKGASWHATCSSGRKTYLICVFHSKLTPWRRLELSPSRFPLSASKTSSVSSENAGTLPAYLSWSDSPRLFRLFFLWWKWILHPCWRWLGPVGNGRRAVLTNRLWGPTDPQGSVNSDTQGVGRTWSLNPILCLGENRQTHFVSHCLMRSNSCY